MKKKRWCYKNLTSSSGQPGSAAVALQPGGPERLIFYHVGFCREYARLCGMGCAYFPRFSLFHRLTDRPLPAIVNMDFTFPNKAARPLEKADAHRKKRARTGGFFRL